MRDLLYAAVVAAVLGGCAHHHHGPRPEPRPERPAPKICREIDVAQDIDPEEACPPWRRVALKRNPGSDCPVPEVDGKKWKVAHLFEAASTNADRWKTEYADALPPALRPFCLYEYLENDPDVLEKLNEKLDRLVGPKSILTRIDDGCAAVGPAGGDDPSPYSETWGRLEEIFLEQVGDVEPVTVLDGSEAGDPEGPRVRLTFLDTQPVDKWDRDVNSRHGYALAEMARKIVCNEPGSNAGCTAEIDSRLALPIENFTQGNPEDTTMNWDLGGYSGSVDFLAAAVWDALRDQERTPEQHLVLNLSVAWNGEVFGGLEDRVEDMPATVQALYRALEVASCRGALVVAAAGNRSEGPNDEVGPLLPGGWEVRDAPNAEACEARLGEVPRRVFDRPEPLVYAAGGVRFDNSPLYNSRPGATPPRVAYASHALVMPSETSRVKVPAKTPKPFTGTSVATAVTSAAASVVWHHWPGLTRARLMDLLYRSGIPVEATADFHHPSMREPPVVRRIAVCKALESACAELGGPCPPACRELPSVPPNWCWSGGSCSKTVDAAKIVQKLTGTAYCGDRTILYDPAMGIPTDPCPSRQYYDAAAWPWQESTLPQPEEDPCAACGPSGGAKGSQSGLSVKGLECGGSGAPSLWIEIDAAWEKTLSQVFLDVGDYSLALGVGELSSGDCFLVENIDFDRFPGLEANPYVTLRFRTEDRRGISVPLQF